MNESKTYWRMMALCRSKNEASRVPNRLKQWRQPTKQQEQLEAQMVTALRELFAKSKKPSHEDKETVAQTLASIIEQAQSLGHDHASEEELQRGMSWGGNFANALSSAWDIVNTFVQRIADWISGSESSGDELTEDDIEAKIDELASTVASVEVASAIEQEVLGTLQERGFMTIRWIAQPGACKICQANADQGSVPIGSAFASGDTIPPAHPGCRCSIGTGGEE